MTRLSGDPFRILAVCTGNICRSPAAERMLVAALGPSVLTESAGTGALQGRPIDPRMATLLIDDGVAVDGFAARQLTEAMVRAADLVLTMTRAQRALVVEVEPAAVRRSFTMLEFARIVSDVNMPNFGPISTEGDCLREVVRVAASTRVMIGARGDDVDVPDPYGGSADDFFRTHALIRSAASTIISGAKVIKGSAGPNSEFRFS